MHPTATTEPTTHARSAPPVQARRTWWLIRFGILELILASEEGAIKPWDVVTGKELHTFRGHTGHVHSLALARDGILLNPRST